MSVTTFVFDAYGTLFDVAAAARRAAADPSNGLTADIWPRLAEDWRRKQLEYTWLRTIMGAYADFSTVTADALDWTLEQHRLTDPALRQCLLDLYQDLPAYPEVPAVLANLRASGYRLAILSNGTPAMLASATRAAGIDTLIEAAVSVDPLRQYKPLAAVYSMVEQRLGVAPRHVMFVSSNGWDIAGATRFGFKTTWVNRANLPQDRLPHVPLNTIPDLTHLPRLLS